MHDPPLMPETDVWLESTGLHCAADSEGVSRRHTHDCLQLKSGSNLSRIS